MAMLRDYVAIVCIGIFITTMVLGELYVIGILALLLSIYLVKE